MNTRRTIEWLTLALDQLTQDDNKDAISIHVPGHDVECLITVDRHEKRIPDILIIFPGNQYPAPPVLAQITGNLIQWLEEQDWDTDIIDWEIHWGIDFRGLPTQRFHEILENIPREEDHTGIIFQVTKPTEEYNQFIYITLKDYAS